MSDTRALVAEAIAATRIQPPARYTWFGRISPPLPTRVARLLGPGATRDHLVHALAGQLYSDFYRRGGAEPPRREIRVSTAIRQGFAAALSAANSGRGFADGGWQVRGIDERGVTVAKNGLELTVHAAELVVTGLPAVGDQVAMRLPKELFDISPGFYLAFGDRLMDPAAERRVVRLYWNLRADGAVPFVRAATRLLNRAGAAFQLKVLNDPGAYDRCDAGVIYLARPDHHELAVPVRALHAEVAEFLSPRTPVFTAVLAPGLGFAEDPGGAESFGEHRCRLLAEALVRAHELGWTDDAAVLGAVERHFARAGVDLDAAYLSPGRATELAGVQ